MTEQTADRTHHALDGTVLRELTELLGERVTISSSSRTRHGQDESYHKPFPPDAVAYPTSNEEVAALVKICSSHRVPMVPYGVGTSLEGNIAALRGGICIDMGLMNRVLEVNADDMDARVEAGITRKQLNSHLRDTGLFFPIDPGADATIGGMTATRASGTTAVRYGTMRENVLGLTVVLADGSIVRTGGRARKSAAGYDLTRLFVGSEGTLGVITEIGLRLHPVPQATTSAVCPFATLEGAVKTVMLTIQSGIPVARIELLDEVQMQGVNRYSKLNYPVQPTLFFEFHGTEAGAAEQAQMVGEIAREHGGPEFQWASKPEDRSRLWQARHDTLYAGMSLRPKSRALVTDVCVPISRLAECVLETRRDIDSSGLIVPIVGHVGDGNFHLLILVDPDNPAEIERAMELNTRLVNRAVGMGGTCTGEHGVGYGKIEFVEQEHGAGVALMRRIKTAMDPLNLMNPGKVIRDIAATS